MSNPKSSPQVSMQSVLKKQSYLLLKLITDRDSQWHRIHLQSMITHNYVFGLSEFDEK